jgi:hypothetical protein
MYKHLVVRIEFSLNHPIAGVRFVGCELGDDVVPHLLPSF